jgi:hypothetical protein
MSNPLHELSELRQLWRAQGCRYSEAQRRRYDELMVARRARVAQFYAAGRVA